MGGVCGPGSTDRLGWKPSATHCLVVPGGCQEGATGHGVQDQLGSWVQHAQLARPHFNPAHH